jgi:hypothetical protein
MSLAAKLDEIRAGAVKRIPPDKLVVLQQATAALRDSGIMRGVIAVGQALPPFELNGAGGDVVSSDAVLARGAVVLTVFRGHW